MEWAVCCICCLVSLFIAYVIWAVMTIVTSGDAANTPCGETYNIWAFCLATVIVMPLVGCILSLVANLGGIPQLMAIPPIINLGFFIWSLSHIPRAHASSSRPLRVFRELARDEWVDAV